MLVLSRKLNQSIQVGENISITIVRVKGNVVQLGIVAPREVPVVRAELLERDARQAVEQQRASANRQAPLELPIIEQTAEANPATSARLLAAS